MSGWERSRPTSAALNALSVVGSDVGTAPRLNASSGRQGQAVGAISRPGSRAGGSTQASTSALDQAQALLVAGHVQAALEIHRPGQSPASSSTGGAAAKEDDMDAIMRKAMAVPLGSTIHGSRVMTEYARKYGSAGGAGPAGAAQSRRWSSGAVVAGTAPPPEFMASIKDKPPEINSSLFKQLQFKSGSLSHTPSIAAASGSRSFGKSAERQAAHLRPGTASSSAPRPHKATPYKPGMVLMPPGTPGGPSATTASMGLGGASPELSSHTNIGTVQRPPTSGGRQHYSRPSTANPITHELITAVRKTPGSQSHTGASPGRRATTDSYPSATGTGSRAGAGHPRLGTPNFFQGTAGAATQPQRLRTAGPAGRAAAEPVSSRAERGQAMGTRPRSTPASLTVPSLQATELRPYSLGSGGDAGGGEADLGHAFKAMQQLEQEITTTPGVNVDPHHSRPPTALGLELTRETDNAGSNPVAGEDLHTSRPGSRTSVQEDSCLEEATSRMATPLATPNPFAPQSTRTPGLPPRPPPTGQLPPSSTATPAAAPTPLRNAPGPTHTSPGTPAERPYTAASSSNFSTAGLVFGRQAGRPDSACADSVDLALARIRAENERPAESINIIDDMRPDMEVLSLSDFGIKEDPPGKPAWQGAGAGKPGPAGTKRAIDMAAAKRRSLMKQAAPMVLDLQNLVDSTPEVLEMELGRMTFDELLELDARVAAGSKH